MFGCYILFNVIYFMLCLLCVVMSSCWMLFNAVLLCVDLLLYVVSYVVKCNFMLCCHAVMLFNVMFYVMLLCYADICCFYIV